MTATFIKTMTGFRGDARLYQVEPPIEYGYDEHKATSEFVIVSAVSAMFSGPETYIFPAGTDGEILDWGELPGSFKGSFDHEEALRGAGYTVKS